MENKILEILEEVRPEFEFGKSEDFIEDGLLDSFDIVTIIDSLEKEFGIVIDGLDVVPENFVNVDSIKSLVEKSVKK